MNSRLALAGAAVSALCGRAPGGPAPGGPDVNSSAPESNENPQPILYPLKRELIESESNPRAKRYPKGISGVNPRTRQHFGWSATTLEEFDEAFRNKDVPVSENMIAYFLPADRKVTISDGTDTAIIQLKSGQRAIMISEESNKYKTGRPDTQFSGIKGDLPNNTALYYIKKGKLLASVKASQCREDGELNMARLAVNPEIDLMDASFICPFPNPKDLSDADSRIRQLFGWSVTSHQEFLEAFKKKKIPVSENMTAYFLSADKAVTLTDGVDKAVIQFTSAQPAIMITAETNKCTTGPQEAVFTGIKGHLPNNTALYYMSKGRLVVSVEASQCRADSKGCSHFRANFYIKK